MSIWTCISVTYAERREIFAGRIYVIYRYIMVWTEVNEKNSNFASGPFPVQSIPWYSPIFMTRPLMCATKRNVWHF